MKTDNATHQLSYPTPIHIHILFLSQSRILMANINNPSLLSYVPKFSFLGFGYLANVIPMAGIKEDLTYNCLDTFHRVHWRWFLAFAVISL